MLQDMIAAVFLSGLACGQETAEAAPSARKAVERTLEFLESLDAFVMISEPAGCPNASLEAMAAGLPVFATDHGGAADQVVDGHTGRLTPRGDPASLADAIVDGAADRERLWTWGIAGRDRIESRFSLERMADAYSRVLFDRLLDRSVDFGDLAASPLGDKDPASRFEDHPRAVQG